MKATRLSFSLQGPDPDPDPVLHNWRRQKSTKRKSTLSSSRSKTRPKKEVTTPSPNPDPDPPVICLGLLNAKRVSELETEADNLKNELEMEKQSFEQTLVHAKTDLDAMREKHKQAAGKLSNTERELTDLRGRFVTMEDLLDTKTKESGSLSVLNTKLSSSEVIVPGPDFPFLTLTLCRGHHRDVEEAVGAERAGSGVSRGLKLKHDT